MGKSTAKAACSPCVLLVRYRQVTAVRARQRQQHNACAGERYGQEEDAALRAGDSTGEPCAADGMGGEEMAARHQAAVRHAIEKGLRPVPGGVEADGPPQRSGAPEAEAEEKAGETRGEQAERRLARIAAVSYAEEIGQRGGGGPEAECVRVARAEMPAIESAKATRQGELQIAAAEELLLEGKEQ